MLVSYTIDTNINNMVRFLSSISKFQLKKLTMNNPSYVVRDINKKISTDYLLNMASAADRMMARNKRADSIIFFLSPNAEDELFRGLVGAPSSRECYLMGRPCVLLTEEHIGKVVGFAIMIGDHIHFMSKARFV